MVQEELSFEDFYIFSFDDHFVQWNSTEQFW